MLNRVYLFDTTLRDGEQSPGCSMTVPEKLRLARKLVELGVDVLEAGFPIASDGDYEAVDAALARVRDEYGEIDVVVSGAAGNFIAPVLGMSSNAFKTVIDIDLLGTFNVLEATRCFAPPPSAVLE